MAATSLKQKASDLLLVAAILSATSLTFMLTNDREAREKAAKQDVAIAYRKGRADVIQELQATGVTINTGTRYVCTQEAP